MSRATALASAGMAFALNCASFLLIGNTSALTLQLAGVVKDWLLILMSAAVFRHALTPLNLGGYGVAFAGALPGALRGPAARPPAHAARGWTCAWLVHIVDMQGRGRIATGLSAFALLARAA